MSAVVLHNAVISVRINGPLDNAGLRRALAAALPDGAPTLVERGLPVRPGATDLPGVAETFPGAEAVQGSGWRATLVALAADHHLLMLAPPPQVADMSISVLLSTLVKAYRDAVSPEVAGGVEGADGRPSGAPEPIELPFAERRGEPGPTETAATADIVIPDDLAESVRALAAVGDCPSSVPLLAAFVGLLHRYCGDRDITVEMPGELDSAGYSGDPVAVRSILPDDPTGHELWSAVRAGYTAALTRPVPRWAGYQFAFTGPAWAVAVGETEFRYDRATAGVVGHDFELCMSETITGISGFLRSRAGRFTRAQLDLVAAQYLRVLDWLVTDTGRRLSACALLDPADRDRAVRTWNATDTDYPADRSLVELFEQVADATPDAPAVDFPDARLTYAELDQRANRFAHHLVGLGIGPGALVGLCLGRSADWVVCALGTIKAGAAYLPLDPEYPAQRLAAMAEDGGPAVIVVHESAVPRYSGVAATVLVLDELREPLGRQSAARPDVPLGPHDLAYVMYTSGSTGRAKGVAVTHRNVIRLVRDTDYVQIRPADRIAQASNTAFDAATFEVWGALLCGAELVGITRDELLDGARLGAVLREREVDIMFLTTALAMQIGRTEPTAFNSLRCLLFGGEQADGATVRRLLAAGGPEHLVNVYGPTECTTFASAHPCVDAADTDPVPLGRPIANTQIYVLDRAGEPVPVGVAGELYIGGDGVADGYWRAPTLTAQRFVPDPFSGRPGARLYRTGDLARYRADGRVEFLGRLDRQIKIRGFRIEPAEIESCLHRSPLVRHATVQVRRGPGDEPILVGYVVPAQPGGDLAGVRAQLVAELPAHLVPAALVALPALPLTQNGKLDVAALPEPPVQLDAAEAEPPHTADERRVAGIWQDVLGVPVPGRAENFFRLGGHSLKVAQVTARTAEEFGVPIPLRTLFDHATVAEFAAAVGGLAARRGATAPPPAMNPAARARDLTDLLDELDTLSADELTALAGPLNGAMDD